MQKLVWQNSNGDEIDLTSGNYGITNWEGFSNTSLDIQTQKVPFNDGSVYLDSLLNERELNVTLAIQDNNDLEARYRLRRELIHILNPKLGEGYLIYTNDFTSKRIKCIPQVPLFENHNSNDSGTPKASLSWTACEPYWEDLEETILEIINGQKMTLNNEGDTSCGVKINVYDSGTNVQIKNEVDGKRIEIEQISQNSNVYINTNVGEKSVEVESGIETKSILNNNCDYCCFVDSLNEEMYINNGVIIVGDKCYAPYQMYYTLYGFAENDDIYVFLAKDSYNFCYIYYSVGKSFTNLELALGNQNEIFGVKYIAEKGIFIAYGRVMWKSSDGIEWENISINDVYYDVCYNPKNSTYYLAKVGGDIDKSTDLSTFTTISLPQSASVHQILWDAKDEVLICAGSSILYSDDGNTFVVGFDERSVHADYAIDCGTYFLIYGGPVASPSIFYSYNGKQWNEIPIEHIRNVKHGFFNKVKGNAVILNQNTDTVTINTLPYITETFASGTINSVFSKNDKLYVFFQSGKVCEIDSSKKLKELVTLNEPIKEICYDSYKNKYVGICGNKKIAISADLKNWVYKEMSENVELNSITYDDIEHYIIIGTSSGFYYSADLDNWGYCDELINVNKVFYSKIYKYCIAVGEGVGGCVICKNYNIHNYSRWTNCSMAHQAPTILTDITEDNEYIYVSGRSGLNSIPTSGYILYSSDLYNFKYLIDSDTEIYIAFNTVKNTKYGIITGGYAYESNSNLVITNDKFENVTKKDFSLSEINGVVIRENNGNVIIYGDDFIYEITSTSKENAIKKLSINSDMSFALLIGENSIFLQSNNYNTTGQILYRQKYIGV